MKILLVQTGFLGDVVLSTPVIAGLKEIFPQSELWIMVHKGATELVQNDPLLSGILVFDKHGKDKSIFGMAKMVREIKAHQFSRVYSLHKSARTALLLAASKIPVRVGFKHAKLSFLYTARASRPSELHDVLRNLSLLTVDKELRSFSHELRLFAAARSEVFQKLQLESLASQSYVVLSPGSAWKTKMWHWHGYREVAQHFLRLNYGVLLLGGPGENETAQKVADGLNIHNLVGKTSLSQMLALVKSAALMVCNDSLALHVASAFKVPSVALFCSTSPAFGFGPWKNKHCVLEVEGLPCKPCGRHGWHRCPTGTEACMTQLPAARVISAGQELLAG